VTIYYRGRCARITHRAFETSYPPRSYAIAELRKVWVVQRRTERFVDSAVVRVCSSGVTTTAILGTLWGWTDDLPVFPMVLISAVLIVTTLTILAWPADPGLFELWAYYRGRAVCLLRCSDGRKFGQIRRALSRALDHFGES